MAQARCLRFVSSNLRCVGAFGILCALFLGLVPSCIVPRDRFEGHIVRLVSLRSAMRQPCFLVGLCSPLDR